MEEGKSQTSQVLKENSDISDFTCYQIDQFVQTQVYLTFFNQCYLANVMVLKKNIPANKDGCRALSIDFVGQAKLEIQILLYMGSSTHSGKLNILDISLKIN